MSGLNLIPREEFSQEGVEQRLKHYREFVLPAAPAFVERQGARCLDCGVPFCQGPKGCPVKNLIPDWNDLVKEGRWKEAYHKLELTNNFPEFTGKLCPAPCETVCIKGIHDDAVAIKSIELSIIEKAYQEGWVQPQALAPSTGKSVAIVGSGPAGLAAAQQLARRGHAVTVFERENRLGGLLRYGIPDFKLEKKFIDRRIEQMEQEGVTFRTHTEIGKDLSLKDLQREFSAVGLTIGAEKPRDLQIAGRQLKGIHFAMEYLTRQNKINASLSEGSALRGGGLEGRLGGGLEDSTQRRPMAGARNGVVRDAVGGTLVAGGTELEADKTLDAKGKRVVVIGGGDTGADCYGTALRQGCTKVYQLEIMPRPSKYKVSSSHEEGVSRGGERRWATATLEFLGDEEGRVRALRTQELEWKGTEYQAKPNSERIIEADLVLLAMGFVGTEPRGLVAASFMGTEPHSSGTEPHLSSSMELEWTAKGTIATQRGSYQTSLPSVFAAGDAKRGASLIVWAIAEGREMAEEVHRFLSDH